MLACLAGILVALGWLRRPDPTPIARDPFEPLNRGVMQVNDVFDAIVLKPGATIYRETVPPLVRTGVSNFFGNLTDVWSFVNSVLQLKIQDAADNFARVQLNTFFGLGGIFDIASEFNIDRHREDFGQTLGRWGVPPGRTSCCRFSAPPPCAIRSRCRWTVSADPVHYVDTCGAQTALVVLRAVDVRHNLLRTSSVLDEAALDKYTFTRDAYLQRRRAEIYEDNPSTMAEGTRDDAGKEPKEDGEPAPKPGAPGAGTPAIPVHRHPRPRVSWVATVSRAVEGLRNPAIGRRSNDDRGSVRTKGK